MPALAVVDAVLLNPQQLLRLRVRQPKLHIRALLARGDSRGRGCRRGRSQDEEVAQDHACDGRALLTGAFTRRVPATNDVDVVTLLQRAREQLVGVPLELIGPLRALDLCADALLLR